MSDVPVLVLIVVLGLMAIELGVSQRHEKRLRSEGAMEPADDVYRWMKFAYPLGFIAMALEGVWRGAPAHPIVVAGLLVLAMSKMFKTWAIVSLGTSWSFHVLVRPGRHLVTRGPYRYLRHPNYLAIAGEIAGMALAAGAPVTGVISLMAMGFLLHRRIAVEERALGLRA